MTREAWLGKECLQFVDATLFWNNGELKRVVSINIATVIRQVGGSTICNRCWKQDLRCRKHLECSVS